MKLSNLILTRTEDGQGKPAGSLRILSRLAFVAVALVGLSWSLGTATAGAAPKYIDYWGQAAALDNPSDAAVDSKGYIYVTDTKNSRVQKFSPNGSFLLKWGKAGNGNGDFSNPIGIAVDSSDNVYVVDSVNSRIQKFDSQGNFITKWGGFGNQDGQFLNPEGIAIDNLGRVYVADTTNQRIEVFSATGNFIGKWGTPGQGDGQFLNPRGVAVDANNNIYVTESTNNRVQKFTFVNNVGVYQAKWGSGGQKAGQFSAPAGIDVSLDGSILVADSGNNRIQQFKTDGTFVDTWGGKGTGPGQFDLPISVTAGRDDGLYVANSLNDRIEVYAFEPNPPVLATTDPGSPSTSLNPRILGQTAISTSVKIFNTPDCSGNPVGEGESSDLSSKGIQVSVTPGSTTTFRAQARNKKFGLTSDCSPTTISYTHVLPPKPPTDLTVSPASPGASVTPTIFGKATAAEANTIRLYKTADCSGEPVATGTVENFGKVGFPVAVEKGSTTTFRATAKNDQFNLTSACSSSTVTYTQKDPIVDPPPPPDPCTQEPRPASCGGPPPVDPVPTATTAVFDGQNLVVRLKCPARFKPKCISRAVPVTASGFRKVKRKGRVVSVPKGKPMASVLKVTTGSNKWQNVTFRVKPAFIARLNSMARVDARLLTVRQSVRSKRVGSKPSRKASTLFHRYKVLKKG